MRGVSPTKWFGAVPHLRDLPLRDAESRQDVVAEFPRSEVPLPLGQGPEAQPVLGVLLAALVARSLVAGASHADRERTPAQDRVGGV